MSWLFFSIATALLWGTAELFYKKGALPNEKYSHLKICVWVGVVMGAHAIFTLLTKDIGYNPINLLRYLPVSLLYILSMAMGYLGLRYIELSISSPICNASGALVAVLAILTMGESYPPAVLVAIGLVCLGVIGLGVVEYQEDDEARAARQEIGNFKYSKSWLALALPIAYCILDAAGTFADSLVLDKLSLTYVEYEASANVAYELTFLLAGIVCFIYTVLIKKDKLIPKMEAPKYIGACFETVGQFAYIYAIADTAHLAMSAPIISAYCAASVLWSRLFLKEKLSWKHYLCIGLALVGIIIMGVFDV